MATTSDSADSIFPNLGITVESNPSYSRLSELGINSWPKWVLILSATFSNFNYLYILASNYVPDSMHKHMNQLLLYYVLFYF